MQPVSTSSSRALPRPWNPPWQSLRLWFKAYLISWLGGAGVFLAGAFLAASGSENAGGVVAIIGGVSFFGSLIPYVGSVYFAYNVQKALHAAGAIRSAPWQVLVAAFVLNPFLAGFYVPYSVSAAARRASAQPPMPPNPGIQRTRGASAARR